MFSSMGKHSADMLSRMPHLIAKQPFPNGWTASILLMGPPDDSGSTFEIAPMTDGMGLSHDSLRGYMRPERAEAMLNEIAGLPAFDAPLRSALIAQDPQGAKRALALSASASPIKLAGDQGADLSLQRYASLCRSPSARGSWAKARSCWLALLKAGYPFEARDLTALLSELPNGVKRAQAFERLAAEMVAPLFISDQTEGGSLAQRARAQAESERSELGEETLLLAHAAFAAMEARSLCASAAPAPAREKKTPRV